MELKEKKKEKSTSVLPPIIHKASIAYTTDKNIGEKAPSRKLSNLTVDDRLDLSITVPTDLSITQKRPETPPLPQSNNPQKSTELKLQDKDKRHRATISTPEKASRSRHSSGDSTLQSLSSPKKKDADFSGAITMDLVCKKNMIGKMLNVDEKTEAILRLTHVRLDRCSISEIRNLDTFASVVTNLYFQHNLIKKIENLECLLHLRFLVLSHNLIEKIENLKLLRELVLLDLSHNRISELQIDQIPKKLTFLLLAGNPCSQSVDYREKLISSLPELQEIDEVLITQGERIKANHLSTRELKTEEAYEDAEDDDEDYFDYIKMLKMERRQVNEQKKEDSSSSEIVNDATVKSESSHSSLLDQARDDILKRSKARQQNMASNEYFEKVQALKGSH